jgi:hypothetical protein
MSGEASTLLLEHHLKVLKLPTFVRDYKSVAAVCAQERCDYPTFLLRLAERELIDRERRAAERRIRDARFPVVKTIDTFDFKAQPSINQALVRELIQSGEYISKPERPIYPSRWALPPVRRARGCASPRRRRWSPRCLKHGKAGPCNAARNSLNGLMCSSWMNSDTFRSPRREPSYSLR